jgi:myo-inositol 2-dehydrogenase / D-chiro-inositol 1-dehydrogenase
MENLKIAVVGSGLMGTDHIARINQRISGAEVAAVVEIDPERAASGLSLAPSAKHFRTIEEAIEARMVDAVIIATPGQFHEPVLLPSIQAKLPTLCEKPLTPDPKSALRVVEAEVAGGIKLIQVGFMRRFDSEYQQLRELVLSASLGELLGLRCQHRNPSVAKTYQNEMLIFDSVVHEIDIARYLTGSPVTSVEIKHMKRNSNNLAHLKEPILVLLETASGVLVDVEMNVSGGFGYQVKTEAVFEKGIAEIGRTAGMTRWEAGRFGQAEHMTFASRFAMAYDEQVQRWVRAARNQTIDGPSAWDGYLAAAAVEAGVKALDSSLKEEVVYAPTPSLYR